MVCDTFILEHVVTYAVALDMFLDKRFFDLCSLQVNMDADRAQPSSTSATSWGNCWRSFSCASLFVCTYYYYLYICGELVIE
jgi:hypothetical protein